MNVLQSKHIAGYFSYLDPLDVDVMTVDVVVDDVLSNRY